MCGIWGIINREPEDFDYCSFTTLGIANDIRGGDSCGIFIDGDVEYGVLQNKLFSQFMFKSKLLTAKYNNKTLIAIGHDRKASVGAINEQTAQPVILRNEKGEVEFVVVHNGTIYNYLELAKKHIPDVKVDGLTDSQVMARIFYHKGYDVLSEYEGGGAFVIVDYRKQTPLTLLFHGESINSEYGTKTSEERPLFVALAENELVFSSIALWLYSIRPWSKINTLATNRLVSYMDGKLEVVKEYDRTKQYQVKRVANMYYGGVWKKSTPTTETYNTSTWIRQDSEENLYYVLPKELLHGTMRISTYGRILENNQNINNVYFSIHEVSFFSGVPMKNKKAFKYVCRLAKLAKLDPEMFLCAYENLVRYFSADQLFFSEGKLCKAISPSEYIPYTGKFQMLGLATSRDFKDGCPIGYCSGGSADDSFNIIDNNYKFDFKTLTKTCLSMMNS